MAVKIRLRRVGRKKSPMYRIVVADSKSPRDGKFIEIVGQYQPRTGDQATIVNFSFTGTIYPGYSLSIGFSGTSTGTFVPPSGFVLNGSRCPVTINH